MQAGCNCIEACSEIHLHYDYGVRVCVFIAHLQATDLNCTMSHALQVATCRSAYAAGP